MNSAQPFCSHNVSDESLNSIPNERKRQMRLLPSCRKLALLLPLLTALCVPAGCTQAYSYTFVNVSRVPLHVRWFGKDLTTKGFEFDLAPGAAAYCEEFGGGGGPRPEVSSAESSPVALTSNLQSAGQSDGHGGYVLPIDEKGTVFPVKNIMLSYRKP
jgi:hypothetical protein